MEQLWSVLDQSLLMILETARRPSSFSWFTLVTMTVPDVQVPSNFPSLREPFLPSGHGWNLKDVEVFPPALHEFCEKKPLLSHRHNRCEIQQNPASALTKTRSSWPWGEKLPRHGMIPLGLFFYSLSFTHLSLILPTGPLPFDTQRPPPQDKQAQGKGWIRGAIFWGGGKVWIIKSYWFTASSKGLWNLKATMDGKGV